MPRTITIDRNRLPGWFQRFEEQQGQLKIRALPVASTEAVGSGHTSAVPWILEAPSGHVLKVSGTALAITNNARRDTPERNVTQPSAAQDSVAVAKTRQEPPSTWRDLLAIARWDPTVGIVLIRRGGFSIGVARAGKLLASKSDTKYVQGRTAAGGWSQQRFARRRAGQTSGLLDAATAAAMRIFAAHDAQSTAAHAPETDSPRDNSAPTHSRALEVLAVGGDRALLESVLTNPALAPWAGLPCVQRTVHGDPRQRDAVRVAEETQALTVTITDP